MATVGAAIGLVVLVMGYDAYTAAPKPAPPAAGTQQAAQVSARRGPDGHFYFNAAVNGNTVRMLFDTGASVVMLSAEDAARAGVNTGSLDYSVPMQTANGVTKAAKVMLRTLRVGGITRQDVLAVVAQPGVMPISLLGQSFMSRLGGYRYENGYLVMQDR